MRLLPFELRHTIRSLRRNSTFTVVSVLTLALGSGVVTALFAVVNAVLLQPIAVQQDRVVRIWKLDAERGLDRHPLSYPEFLDARAHARAFDALAAINYADRMVSTVAVDERPARAWLTPVSSDFFSVLLHRAPPLHGRWFDATDEREGAEVAAVVSEGFWRRISGGDPAFVGRRLRWSGGRHSVIVVGVAPAALDYPVGTDMWVPIARFFGAAAQSHIDVKSHRSAQFELLGRLRAGVAPGEARSELQALERGMVSRFPDDYRPMRLVVTPVLDTVVGDARAVLLFLLAAAGLVFVIAGVNAAALLLMRAESRRGELAVRAALGADRSRIVRDALSESLALGVAGALIGLLIAHLLLAVVHRLALTDVPRLEDAAVDWRVAGFCAAAALAWVVALGTVPVWRRKLELADPAGAPSGFGSRRTYATRGLRLFSVAEIAAAVVVAIGAGLLVRSFAELNAIERGFDSRNLSVVPILLPESRYPDARARLAFYEQLLPRIGAIRGVVAASAVHLRPGTGTAGLSAGMTFEGQTPDEAARNPWANWEPVTPSYFRALGIPVLRGRGFTEADAAGAAPVAVVSESVARRYWPGEDPIGKRVQFSSGFAWSTVVGVTADVRYRELTKTWLSVYFPASQFFFFSPGSLVVRTRSAPEPLVPAIRETIRSLEPGVPLDEITTMDALLGRELARPRAAFTIAALFALMAVVLAAVGVYGVLSYEVHQRRWELAIRSALGASPGAIYRDVVFRALALGAAGVLAGALGSSVVTRFLRALLYGVQPSDPLTILAGGGVLLAVVLLSCLVPAARAAAADPAQVLRAE